MLYFPHKYKHFNSREAVTYYGQQTFFWRGKGLTNTPYLACALNATDGMPMIIIIYCYYACAVTDEFNYMWHVYVYTIWATIKNIDGLNSIESPIVIHFFFLIRKAGRCHLFSAYERND